MRALARLHTYTLACTIRPVTTAAPRPIHPPSFPIHITTNTSPHYHTLPLITTHLPSLPHITTNTSHAYPHLPEHHSSHDKTQTGAIGACLSPTGLAANQSQTYLGRGMLCCLQYLPPEATLMTYNPLS